MSSFDCSTSQGGHAFGSQPRILDPSGGQGGTPGPGSYDACISGPGQPAWSFGGVGDMSDRSMASTQNVPGPGQYDPGLKSGGPAFSFGGSEHKPLLGSPPGDGTPGPEYDLPGSFGANPASTKTSFPSYSMSGASTRGVRPTRATDGKFYDVDGAFGTMSKSGKLTVAAYSMGHGARTGGEGKGSGASQPGPGTYGLVPACGAQIDSSKPSGSAFSMGKASRGGAGGVAHGESTPGPGTYSEMDSKAINAIKPSAPNFSMGGARSRPASAGAGDGRYYDRPGAFGRQGASTRNSVPAFSMGRASRGAQTSRPASKASRLPGPGSYDLPGAFGKMSDKHTASAFSMGRSNGRGEPKRRESAPVRLHSPWCSVPSSLPARDAAFLLALHFYALTCYQRLVLRPFSLFSRIPP